MNYINEDFLKGTKRLQTILDAQSPTPDDTEFKSILLMTDNQYKKISKVWNDDMHIYHSFEVQSVILKSPLKSWNGFLC